MKLNIHRSVNKTGYFLDSLIAYKSLKLVDHISNQLSNLKFLIINITKLPYQFECLKYLLI